VLTSASTLTLDVIVPVRPRMNAKKTMLTVRFWVLVFIAISAAIAIRQATDKSIFIAQMMGVSWGALAGAFLAPFLYGLYWKKTTKAAVAVSFAYGVGLEVLQLLISLKLLDVSASPLLSVVFKNSLYSGVFAMVGGLVLVPLLSVFTQKTRPDGVEEQFACYNDKKTVDITDSLGE